jgi:two-component system NtrC family sensor kinase
MTLKAHDFRINNISATTEVMLSHPEIMIDEQLMTQVVVNILNNAEQACVSARGRGFIAVAVQEVNDSVRISISDDGPGISQENLAKVFDPFFTTKGVGEGTGLGLSVSYGIIAQLGGNIWAESDGSTGTKFHIDIPLASDQRDSGPAVSEDSADEAPTPRYHVLVVDDEPDLRDILTRVIERRGHNVDQAGNGEEAWTKLQSTHYDCILLDLRMAGTDGQTLFQRISASDPHIAEKVIFVTGDVGSARTRSFLASVTNPVLRKPVSVDDLEQAMSAKAKK